MLLVAVGRAPVTEDLGLEALGVEVERGFVRVDGFMRTAVPHIYAIGDVVPQPLLAHVASAEGILAVEHMAGHEPRPIDYDHVPSCTYCDPEVASVGLTEAKARERATTCRSASSRSPRSARRRSSARPTGFVKIVREKKYDEVLGVHIVGAARHRADRRGLRRRCGLETTDRGALSRTIHPHPTLYGSDGAKRRTPSQPAPRASIF